MIALTNQQHEAPSVILRGRERNKGKKYLDNNKPPYHHWHASH
jgi:hypothetical protein